MNKNSKHRALLIRAQAKESRPTSEGGKIVISCNEGKAYMGGCERVYINKGADGKKFSITRHEPIAADGHWARCRSKVGQTRKKVREASAA